jgi:8-oxo-dGTP diphosphatase
MGYIAESGRWIQWTLVREVSAVIDPESQRTELLGGREVIETPDDGVLVLPHPPGAGLGAWPENPVVIGMLARIGINRRVHGGVVAWLGVTDPDSGLHADLSNYRLDCLHIMAAQAHAHIMTTMQRSASWADRADSRRNWGPTDEIRARRDRYQPRRPIHPRSPTDKPLGTLVENRVTSAAYTGKGGSIMTTVGDEATTNRIQITVRAMIGHGEQILLLHQPDDYWLLPGGHVAPGEPVELALSRRINEILNIELESASFLAVVEDCHRDRLGNDHHEVNLIFDVTLASVDVQCGEDSREVQWTPWEELSAIDLRPVGLRVGLRSSRFSNGDRWVPWRPSAVH